MKLVIIFLDEKHPSIIIKTLDIFEKLLVCIKEHSKKLNMEYDFNITDRILDKIKEKLGDVSSKVRMKAVNLYFFMLQQDFCDYNNLITELLEEEIRKYDITDNLTINSSINKRHRATTKLTLGKLQIFNKVLDDVQNAFNKKQTSLETFPYNTLSEYLIIYVDHNRSEIRKLTRLCIGKFIKKFGFDKIKKKLEKVKVRELNKLIMELPQYESQIKDIINGSDSTIVTNRNILNSLNTSNVNINSLNVTNVSNIFSANRTNFSNIGKVKVTVGTRSHKKGFKSSSMAMLPVKKHKLKLKPIAAISKRVKINK